MRPFLGKKMQHTYDLSLAQTLEALVKDSFDASPLGCEMQHVYDLSFLSKEY